MAFTSLATRLQDIPLLMCGPILRRVEADAVTVWVALKKTQKVWLEVYEDTSGSGAAPILTKILSGERVTTRLGDHLHITAVTAALVNAQAPMTPGKLYYYNLFFTDTTATTIPTNAPNLETPGMIGYEIHYAHEPEDLDPQHLHAHLPSFCLAPEDLNHVRIVHGSCRKAHSEGVDAMPGIDDMIMSDRWDAMKRPHYLLLTGDQFYADDISPIMLYLLMDAEKSLMGSVEELPEEGKPALPDVNGENWKFYVGERKDKGGFTSHESNHLATAGEYMSYYLFMWSAHVWPAPNNDDYPDSSIVGMSGRSHHTDRARLKRFYDGLAKVKRAMANVPTYMIFDDHDVTDDWYMTLEWCEGTLKNDLGRRMITNGLLSYALFQAWGNTPQLYAPLDASGNPTKGKLLLDAAEAWFVNGTKRDNINSSQDVEPTLQKYLGVPSTIVPPMVAIAGAEPGTIYYMINQGPDALRWDFLISRTNYEIKFLDGRTRRGYPNPAFADRKEKSHPDIISEQSMVEQFDHDTPLSFPKEVTLVVAPTSVVSIPAIEFKEFPGLVSTLAKSKFNEDIYEFDVFDHWRNQSYAAEKLIKQLAERNTALTVPGEKKQTRVVILTGDVHFAAASRVEFENADNRTLFAQLVSSSFLKQDIKTRLLHQRGYKFGNLAALALGRAFITKFPEEVAGWPVVGPILVAPLSIVFVMAHIISVMLDKLLAELGPDIIKDWYDPKGMPPRHFLGWSDPGKEGRSRMLILKDGKLEVVKLLKPSVIEADTLKIANEPKLKYPEWQYRIDFMTAANEVRPGDPPPGEELTAPSPGDRSVSLQRYLALAKYHSQYAKKWGNGKEIVGVNNISEIFFDWGDTQKSIRQETWWRVKDEDKMKLFPLSKFTVPLNFNDSNYPLPAMPQAPNP